MNLIISHWKFVAILALLATAAFLYKRLKDTETKLDNATITIKSMDQGIQQYKAKDSTWNVRLVNERRTMQDIISSKDSTLIKIKEQLSNAGVKYSNAVAAAYVKTTIVTDTVIKYVRPLTSSVQTDTTLDFSKRPHIINTVKLSAETATNHLEITNEQFILTNGRKETINPRKSFFLWRWFQKRHWVIYTDIHNSNPFIITDDAKFITILENDGSTKSEKR